MIHDPEREVTCDGMTCDGGTYVKDGDDKAVCKRIKDHGWGHTEDYKKHYCPECKRDYLEHERPACPPHDP